MKLKPLNREPMALALAKQEFKTGVERSLFYIIVNQLKTGINVSNDLFQNLEIKINTNAIKETNYQRFKQAAENITSRKIRFVDDKNNEFRFIVPFPEAHYLKGVFTVTMYAKVIEDFVELSKGYSEYELRIMESLRSDYAQRLYEILSGKKKLNDGVWSHIKIDYLKSILNAEIYKTTGSFIQKVIEVAKTELDKKADITFEYEKFRTGRKLTHLTFTIFHNSDKEKIKQEIEEEYNYISTLNNKEKLDLFNSMINKYKFTSKQHQSILQSQELLTKFYETNKKIESGYYTDIENKTKYMAVALGFKK